MSAIAELIAADREYDAAYGYVYPHQSDRFLRAKERRAAALAAVGGEVSDA